VQDGEQQRSEGGDADRAALDRSVDMAAWDARAWLAGLVGCGRDELAVRSTDRYGDHETQVRYERGSESVARLIVTGPVRDLGVHEGEGHWLVSAQIGWEAGGAHVAKVPETDEIVY
jgi:hypothetical protein